MSETNGIYQASRSYEEKLRREIQITNESQGDIEGFQCPTCKNKGFIYYERDGEGYAKRCECMTKRKSLTQMQKSGLSGLLEKYTFDNYQAKEDWQINAKTKAIKFLSDTEKWFFIGGQVGSGKTHLCTAIARNFLDDGIQTKYMLWRDDIVALKEKIGEDYTNQIEKLKGVRCLYIDDFLKTEKGKLPTTADVNIAFELLNWRYNNRNLTTIISSEKTITQVLDLDEAVGSRILEMAKDYCINIAEDRSKNMRLRLCN